MKNTPIILGLLVAVAALGFWSFQLSVKISDSNNEIVALTKKLATAQHDAATAMAQSKHTVEIITTQSSTATNVPGMGKNQVAADPQSALAAAQAMTPGPARDGAMMDALVAIAGIDPRAAWDAAQNFPENAGKGRAQLFKDILKEWAAKDPATAAAKFAAESLTENSATDNNTVGTIETDWLKVDPTAASQWIETLPVGKTRDSAIRALVPAVTQSDAPMAFKWADTLNDPSYRGTLINGVTASWAKTDPDAAMAAVKSRPNKNNGRMEALTALVIQNAPAGWTPKDAAPSP